MAVQGKVRVAQDFTKETGLFEAKVVAVNPTKEQLEKLGITLEKEPEYSGEDGSVKKANVVIYVEDVETKKIKSLRFFLKDLEKTNRDGTKRQYISNMGDTTWTDDEANLPDWFKKKSYRIAKEGEESLYKFLVTWLNNLDKKDPDASIVFDWRKLINGNGKEISELIGNPLTDTVVLLSTVRTVDSNGEKKDYEQVYNQEFLPGYVMKYIRTTKIDENFIEIAKRADRKSRSKLQSFVLVVKDSQYGVKDYFTLGKLEAYDPSKNIVSSDKVISDDDAGY